MTKIALLTDTHWGVRNDSPYFEKQIIQFHEDVFFPYLVKHKIKNIVHLGDLVDKRKSIGYKTEKALMDHFIKPISDNDIELDAIVGNHDLFFRHSTELNAQTELRFPCKHTIYTTPTVVNLARYPVLFLPWICAENAEASLAAIQRKEVDSIMGHLEISGFEMHPGVVMEEGISAKIFKKYHRVYTGHFHHKSDDGKIFYLGCPVQMTWADYNSPKGFHVFDTETRDHEFIQNQNTIYHRIAYDEDTIDPKADYSHLKDKVVKLVVLNKKDTKKYGKFIDKLEDVGIYDLKINDTDNFGIPFVENIDMSEDTATIIKNSVDELDMPENLSKDEMKKILESLYLEGLQKDVV